MRLKQNTKRGKDRAAEYTPAGCGDTPNSCRYGTGKDTERKQKQLTAEDKRYQKAKDEAIKQHEQRVAEIRADIRQQEQKTDKELQLLQQQEHEELHGRGADTRMVEECKVSIKATEAELKYIDDHRRIVFDYQRDREELFDHEEEFKQGRSSSPTSFSN